MHTNLKRLYLSAPVFRSFDTAAEIGDNGKPVFSAASGLTGCWFSSPYPCRVHAFCAAVLRIAKEQGLDPTQSADLYDQAVAESAPAAIYRRARDTGLFTFLPLKTFAIAMEDSGGTVDYEWAAEGVTDDNRRALFEFLDDVWPAFEPVSSTLKETPTSFSSDLRTFGTPNPVN